MLDKKNNPLIFGPQQRLLHSTLSELERAQLQQEKWTPQHREAINKIRLKLMGITVWTLQAGKAAQTEPVTMQSSSITSPSLLCACYVYGLWRQGQRVGLLLATAAQEEEAVKHLLMKISIALHCKLRGRWYQQQPLEFTGNGIFMRNAQAAGARSRLDVADLRFIVILGEGIVIAEDYQQTLPLIKSYAPQQLLAEPALKRETWQSLQAVLPQ